VPIQTCFETENEHKLSRLLKLDGVLLDDWLCSNLGILDSDSRKHIAAGFSKTDLKPEEWLPTIELLRSSLILNAEQMNHCFSALPQTQKNKALKSCFSFYLQSPLSKDKWSCLWDWIGELKTRAFSRFQPFELRLVPTHPSSFLFQELLNTIRDHSPDSRLEIRPMNHLLGSPEEEPIGTIHWGATENLLNRLAERIVADLHSFPTHQAIVTFSGKPESRAYLMSRLSSLGLTHTTLENEPDEKLTFGSDWIRRLRNNPSFTFEEKLKINSILLQYPARFEEGESEYQARLIKNKLLDLATCEKLQGDPRSHPTSSDALDARVTLVPWMKLPTIPGFLCYSFCDESLLEVPVSELLLSNQELEQLFFAGFQLPRWTELCKARLDILESLARCRNVLTFSSLPGDALSHFLLKPVPQFGAPRSQEAPNYTAQLPIKSFSATQLETYSDCPSKYLYRRLKLTELPRPLSQFALELGQSVHQTLETFFSNHPLPELSEANLREIFEDALVKAVPSLSRRPNLIPFYKKAFERILPHVITQEQNLRELFGSPEKIQVEKEFELNLQGTSFIGKIDRIDQLSDGSLLVLDYKTGTVNFTPEQVARGENFQALLYWLGAQAVCNKEPAAILFYDLKKGEVKRGLARETLVTKDIKRALTRGHTLSDEKLNSLIEKGMEILLQLSDQIRKGDFTPKPSPDSCRFCEASQFCREAVTHG